MRSASLSSNAKTALILGGGIGGVVVANELRRRLPRGDRVLVFERAEEHVFAPSLLWLAIGDRAAGAIRAPLSRLLRHGIEVVHGNVETIDPLQRAVTANGERYQGDAIVIALGAQLAPQVIPGLEEAGHDVYTLEGALSLREALRVFRTGRIAVLTAAPLYKCPAAPYEAAMLIEYDCRRRGVRQDVSIDVFAAEPGPMGVAGPAVSASVKAALGAKNIAYHPGRQVLGADASGRRLTFTDGSTADYDLLVYVPPHRAPEVVVAAGLTDATGWIPVNRNTLETTHAGIFALGDVSTIPLSLGKPLPKAGVFAHAQAQVVARNIVRAWTKRGKAAAFDGHGACFVEVGDGRAAIGKGNFYAEPVPEVTLYPPSRPRHWAKVIFERTWLRRLFA